METNSSANLTMGIIAGATIFLGLPVAFLRGIGEKTRGSLTMAACGVLLLLIVDVGYNVIESLERTAMDANWHKLGIMSAIVFLGLMYGLVGLAKLEERRGAMKGEADPYSIATMIAIGIGLHNFAEGLAIGQSFSGGSISLGVVLVVGFALHNATEGFGIAAPLAGKPVGFWRIAKLGLIGGGPTAVGALMGGVFVNEYITLLFLTLAVGSLIYVVRELMRLRFASLTPSGAMLALSIGLLFGIYTEIAVEAATNSSRSGGVQNAIEIDFSRATAGKSMTVPAGSHIVIKNSESTTLEFESDGLFPGEVFIKSGDRAPVTITTKPGQYKLIIEDSEFAPIDVKVTGGDK
jgi:ZIP family zinc transporter